MSIVRVTKRDNPFVQIDKRVFEDPELSWKAKGIMGYLLSKPDNWKTYIADLEKRSKDGRDSVRAGIKELEQRGYLVKVQLRDENGKFKGWEYEVREIPEQTESGLAEIGKSEFGKTEIGKTTINNNELRDKEENNNKVVLVEEQVYQFYQNHFGIPSSYTMTSMNQWINDLSPELVLEALKITYKDGKTWKYTEGILRNWAKDGITSLNDLEKQKEKKSAPRRRSQADVWNAFNNYINSLGDEEDE
jgi:DnaD/phage-associated family protein